MPSLLVHYTKKEKVSLGGGSSEFKFTISIEDELRNGLEELGSLEWKGNKANYQTLMSSLVSKGANDSVDVDKAYDALKGLVNSVKDNAYKVKLKNLSSYIEAIDKADEAKKSEMKAFIVHKMAVVMAQSPRYEKSTIKQLLSGRKVLYDAMLKKTDI